VTDDLARLLAAIRATPEDDAPRLVYADALIDRGDPRGDFIVRQCRGDEAKDLLDQHGRGWLEGLGPLLMSYTFERGFLAKARFAPSPELGALERAVGKPIWATVRELHGPLKIALHEIMRSLRVLHTQGDADWRELLTGPPRPLEELHYLPLRLETWDSAGDVTATPESGGRWTSEILPEEIAALATCAALPALRKLVLSMIPFHALGTVLHGPVLERVKFEWGSGPIAMTIAGGLATIILDRNGDTSLTSVVLDLIQLLPPRVALVLHHGPNFHGRAEIERIAGPRLRPA
jgi:uncharacterized protein (TIGR02996 family)